MPAPSIAVIGAGITGVTTAHALNARGYDVTLYDRNRHAAMETSFANGGQLSASNAEVWTHASTILKGLRWILRKDAPLRMGLSPSWHKMSWLAEFVGNIPNYEANTIATARLAVAARAEMARIAADEGIAFDREDRGILHVYEDRAGFEHASAVSRLLARGGVERRAVTPEEIAAIEPALQGRFHGGFFTAADATGDIHKFTTGLAAACVRRGVVLRLGTEVAGVVPLAQGVEVRLGGTDAGAGVRHDGVVVCAGVRSRALARGLGDRVNVYPVKGYSITVQLEDAASQAAAPWVSLLDDAAKIVTSRLGPDRFRVAGTAEFAGEDRDIRAARIEPLVAWVNRYFPGVSTRQSVPWAGLRPMMPSMMPRVGAGRRPGVFYNTGHGHLGWTLSAATAEMVGAEVARALPA